VSFVPVARVADVPPGSMRLVTAGRRSYALANVDGSFYALDNDCPHNGGPLARGTLEGSVLRCPWHGWTWDVVTGRNCWPGSVWRATRRPVQVVGDVVQLAAG
jgi:nitrite reductase/ring-hydroxylating ferredoxin subunit